MTLPQVQEVFTYWRESPPTHELLSMLARVYTTWEPSVEDTKESREASLEARWKAGAMNPADMLALYQKTGGKVEGTRPGA